MIHKRAFLAALLVFLTQFPTPLFADFQLLDAIQEFGEKRFVRPTPSRLRTGPVRLHPTLRTKVEYDDNILLEDTDAREDVVFNILPGTILELPINTHQLAVGYEADIDVFTKSRHAKQNDQNQNMFALADIRFPDWYINMLERFTETSGRSGTTFTERIPRFDQSVHPKIGYRVKRLIFEMGYRHFLRDFRRQVDDPLDFQLNEWTGVIYYDLFARLKVLIEYQIAQIDYDDNFVRNGTFQGGRMGLEGEVMPNLFVKIRGGPHFRNYKQDSKTTFKSWVGDLFVKYQMRKNLKLELTADREPIEATFASINFYTRHLLSVGAEYEIVPRWILFTKIKYIWHYYAESVRLGDQIGFRRDRHLPVRCGIRYLPREWLEIELAYQFSHRDSNFPTFDYDDNRFSLTTSLMY